MTSRALALVTLLSIGGCGTSASATPDAATTRDVGMARDAAGTSDTAAADGASGTTDAGASAITADMIRAALGASCTSVSTGLYAPDDGAPETVPICQGPGTTLYWNSDIDVDCDGGRSSTCMSDPAYMPDTSTTGSDGLPIDAETVPFVVIPLPSTRFRYADHGIELGQLALVTYQDRWAIGVFADEGPDNIIGEASYAMNVLLGIDPNPISGGADSGATFVIFTGASARIANADDHAAAVAAAMPLVNALVGR